MTPVEEIRRRVGAGLEVLRHKSTSDPLEWTAREIPPSSEPDDSHLRRVSYIYHQVTEALGLVAPMDLPGVVIEELAQTRRSFETGFTTWGKRHPAASDWRGEYLLNMVRRMHGGGEFGPLAVNSLDAELWHACYGLKIFRSRLLPDECTILYKRILKEARLYTGRERVYDDLSTVWWAIALLADWRPLPNKEWLELVSGLLELSPADLTPDQLITESGERAASHDRSGDLMTSRRSLVFTHRNAIVIRAAVRRLRDPSLSPLSARIHRFGDKCAELWLEMPNEEREELYRLALDLGFCADWWTSRIKYWQEASQILDLERIDVKAWNVSGCNAVVTSQDPFAREMDEVRETIGRYRSLSAKSARPLVVGIFGAPGSGKSFLATALANVDSEQMVKANLSVLEGPSRLFSRLRSRLKETDGGSVLFLDEFDVERDGRSWYQWLLTLLWDGEIPSDCGKPLPLVKNTVVCLAASRYETFADFRRFGFSSAGKEQKVPDVLSRLDAYLNVPPLNPKDRVLVMDACSRGKATNQLLAMCYVAELEDNARGIEKLLKGVSLEGDGDVDVVDLLQASRKKLLEAAGLGTQGLDGDLHEGAVPQ